MFQRQLNPPDCPPISWQSLTHGRSVGRAVKYEVPSGSYPRSSPIITRVGRDHKVNQHHRRETRTGVSAPGFWREALHPCADGAVNTVSRTTKAVSGGAGKDMAIRGGMGRRENKGRKYRVLRATLKDPKVHLIGHSCGVQIPAVSPVNTPYAVCQHSALRWRRVILAVAPSIVKEKL